MLFPLYQLGAKVARPSSPLHQHSASWGTGSELTVSEILGARGCKCCCVLSSVIWMGTSSPWFQDSCLPSSICSLCEYLGFLRILGLPQRPGGRWYLVTVAPPFQESPVCEQTLLVNPAYSPIPSSGNACAGALFCPLVAKPRHCIFSGPQGLGLLPCPHHLPKSPSRLVIIAALGGP